MKERILFKNARLIDNKYASVAVNGEFIEAVGEICDDGSYQRVIDCKGNLLMPGFYNAHGHIPMTLLRGYGEGLPLDRWLTEKIWPAEDRMDADLSECAANLAIAEMIRNGTVSCSDMYMFCDRTADAIGRSGMKANICRGMLSFDPDADPSESERIKETLELFEKYNGSYDGRVKIDLCIHGEYTNVEPMCRYVADLAKQLNTGIQIHLSETEKEHMEGIERRGMTPAAFFKKCGVFDSRTAAAHCVWLSDEDVDILSESGVFAVHNPVSNLKLGSGVMPIEKMLSKGVSVALGTDGASSNNSLSVLKELQFAAILHGGVNRRADLLAPAELVKMATLNGALAQGREDCGMISAGFRADMVLVDITNSHNIPCHDPASALCYTAENSDVLMTVCDGKILYENGCYNTIDVEKITFEAAKRFGDFFASLEK